MSDILDDKLIVLQEQLATEHLKVVRLEKVVRRLENFILDLIGDAGTVYKDICCLKNEGEGTND